MVQPLEVRWGEWMRWGVVEGIFDALPCHGREKADGGSGAGHDHRPMTPRSVCVGGGSGGGCDTMI